jgi:hypothetical protein
MYIEVSEGYSVFIPRMEERSFYVSKVLESADTGYSNSLTGDNCVRIEILKAMNITVFWDTIQGSLINVHRCLGGVCCLR